MLSIHGPIRLGIFLIFIRRLHNTIIYDNVDSCFNGEPSKHCATRQGGLFNSNESTSWSPAQRFEDLRVVGDVDANHENDLFGNDTLAFNSTLSLENFGFGISRDKREEMNVIGLKRNTPFLHALRSAGLIPSSTWAYYQGWTGAEIGDQLNGSLVLGGYDAAKVDGNNITAQLVEDNPNCVSGLVVDIVDMKMNLKNGTNVSILGSSGSSAISGCISPDLPLMYVPPTIMSTFVKASGVTVTGNSGGINFNGTLVSGEAS